jgi:hypothetical protein
MEKNGQLEWRRFINKPQTNNDINEKLSGTLKVMQRPDKLTEPLAFLLIIYWLIKEMVEND